MPCVCAPLQKDGHGFVQWIGTGFADCVYSEKELVSFYLGLSSILIWCFCQAPQFVENYKRGSVEALSKWFLIIWLSGDVTNLVGAILTNQLPTQQYTAMLFVSLDVLMVGQYGYYILLRDKLVARGWVGKRDAYVADGGGGMVVGGGGDMEAPLLDGGEGEEEEEEEEEVEEQRRTGGTVLAATASPTTRKKSPRRRASSADALDTTAAQQGNGNSVLAAAMAAAPAMLVCASLGLATLAWTSRVGASASPAAAPPPPQTTTTPTTPTFTPAFALAAMGGGAGGGAEESCIRSADEAAWVHTLGVVLGWFSSALYMGSRVPQVYRNYVRKSVAGLSYVMFLSAVLGNSTYGASILLRLQSIDQLVAKLPWLIGSLGTLVFDFTILVQLRMYRAERPRRKATGYTPVVTRDGSFARRREPPRLSRSSLAVFVVSGNKSPALYADNV